MKICAECGNQIRRLEIGVMVVAKSGATARADLYVCEECGYKFLAGFGRWLSPETAKAWLEGAKASGETIYDFHGSP